MSFLNRYQEKIDLNKCTENCRKNVSNLHKNKINVTKLQKIRILRSEENKKIKD
jgi:hypothetical protein